MNDLLSLQDLFYKKIFRIPDYQRGYSWGLQQLEEFWNDLYNLLPNKDHYTGMISLKELSKIEISNWINEEWLFRNGYKAYHIVDGQQRLTTFVILINEIVEFYKKNNPNTDLRDIYINGMPLNRIIEDYLYIVDPQSQGIIKTFRFGYEVDNPSYEYFKHKILGEPNGGEVKESLYTLNLENAKNYFKDKIEELVNKEGIKSLENIFNKLTQRIKFNMYYIDNDFNVFVAFETMNNRGKKLSYLELLKNRLIYLSTLFNEPEEYKQTVRNNINDTWKTIYGFLGKNKDTKLNDDEFLQNHWMIYFNYTRSNHITYNSFLLNDYFTQQNIFQDDLSSDLKENNIYEEDIDSDDLIDADESQETSNVKKQSRLTLGDIDKYVKSLKELIQYWYKIHYPNDIDNNEIVVYLERLNRIGFVNFKPLATVTLSKSDISDENKAKIFKSMERFVFLHYRLNGYFGTYKNSFFYILAHKFYINEVSVSDVLNELNKIDFMSSNNVVNATGIFSKFDRKFNGNNKGFYSWTSLRYVLYEYEKHLMFGKGAIRLLPEDIFKIDKKDTISIEHIYPQTPTSSYWINNFSKYDDNEKYRLTGSIGNLLPLSKSINSSLQNDTFEEKKNGKNRIDSDGIARGYDNGSYSELEVSKEDKWTSEEILNRGLKIVNFMEEHWKFTFQNKAEKLRFLGLNFMIKPEDYEIDKIVPIYEETKIEYNKNISYSENDYEKLSSSTTEKLKSIYKELDEYIMSLSNDIKRNSTSHYIGYTNGKSFIEVHFQTNKLYLTIMSGKYDDPKNKIQKLDDRYKWANMNRLDIYEEDDLNYIKHLLKQSCEKTFRQ